MLFCIVHLPSWKMVTTAKDHLSCRTPRVRITSCLSFLESLPSEVTPLGLNLLCRNKWNTRATPPCFAVRGSAELEPRAAVAGVFEQHSEALTKQRNEMQNGVKPGLYKSTKPKITITHWTNYREHKNCKPDNEQTWKISEGGWNSITLDQSDTSTSKGCFELLVQGWLLPRKTSPTPCMHRAGRG